MRSSMTGHCIGPDRRRSPSGCEAQERGAPAGVVAPAGAGPIVDLHPPDPFGPEEVGDGRRGHRTDGFTERRPVHLGWGTEMTAGLRTNAGDLPQALRHESPEGFDVGFGHDVRYFAN